MNNKYKAILEAATEWLDNVDADEFLEDFLVLQEQATGPTVYEFLNGLTNQYTVDARNTTFQGKVHAYGNVFLDCLESDTTTIVSSTQQNYDYFVELNYLNKKIEVNHHIIKKSSYEFLLNDNNESLGYAA